MSPPVRSYLYVPGDRAELVAKAQLGEADAVVIDLEDAVAAAGKAAARENAAACLAAGPAKPTWIRINALQGPLAEVDLDAVALPGLSGIRIPKCERPQDVARVAAVLRERGCDARIECLIESAAGLERLGEIARADPAVRALMLGETDLAVDLGLSSPRVVKWARAQLVVSSRAAGLDPPVQGVYLDLDDLDGLARSTSRAAADGFLGRSAIHPRQLPAINAAFTPDPARAESARALLREVAGQPHGAFTLADGRFVDEAMIREARRVVAIAERSAPPATPPLAVPRTDRRTT